MAIDCPPAVLSDEIKGEGVGNSEADKAQHHSAERKRDGVGKDLFIDCMEAEIMPVERGRVGPA